MPRFPRRALVAVLAAVVAWLSVTLPVEAAEPPPFTTVTGTLTTSDGAPIDRPVLVRLLSIDPDGAFYPTPQSQQLVQVGDSPDFTLDVPMPGYYAVSARPTGGSQYLSSFIGGGEVTPDAYDDPGLLFIREGDTAPRDVGALELRRGFKVTGIVRGSNGQPLDDTTVEVQRWNSSGAIEPIPSTPGFITDAEGRYTATVAAGTQLSLFVPKRGGYTPWVLGGQTTTRTSANSITVDDDLVQDITLTPSWNGLGLNGRIVRDEKCLVNGGAGTADLGGLRLDVTSKGLIVPEDADTTGDDFDPLDQGSDIPALVPYWTDAQWTNFTWGVHDDTLCAIWRDPLQQMAYQVLLTRDGSVTYNYGRIGPNNFSDNQTARAGWTEGITDDATQKDFPRDGEDGFADGQRTSLTAGPAGSTTPGRYRFTFTGFLSPELEPAATAVSPGVVTTARAGATKAAAGGGLTLGTTLQVSNGEWDRDDLRFSYQWFQGWDPIPDAVGPTWTPPADSPAGDYQVRVVANRDGHERVLQDTEFTLAAAPGPDDPDPIDPEPVPEPDDSSDPTPTDAPDDTSAPSDRALPDTGGPSLAPVGLGVLLLAFGIGLLSGRRRPRGRHLF